MEKFPESFDPINKKYKSVEDLPEEKRDDFVNVPGGGFVKKSAEDSFHINGNFAKFHNNERSGLDKLIGLNQLRAIDGAHGNALYDKLAGNTGEKSVEKSVAAEAKEINEKYDRLVQEAQEANEALKVFRRDKLGMQEDSAE